VCDEEPIDPPKPELEVTDNPVTGVLLGPDGRVLVEFRERATLPFGFHPGPR
jgi:hypothetical protein